MAPDSNGPTESLPRAFQMDKTYEFSAPQFFDFINNETEEERRRAELWFEKALSYAPSPFMPRIKTSRSFEIDSLCDFGDSENIHEAPEPVFGTTCNPKEDETRDQTDSVFPTETQNGESHQHQQEHDTINSRKSISAAATPCKRSSVLSEKPSIVEAVEPSKEMIKSSSMVAINSSAEVVNVQEACTPKANTISKKTVPAPNSSRNLTAKKIASIIKQPSALKPKGQSTALKPKCQSTVLKPKNQPQASGGKSVKPTSVRRCPGGLAAKNNVATDIAQENQAIKRQKLDEGRSRQILNVKNRILHHKTKEGLISGNELAFSVFKDQKEAKNSLSQRKMYVREPAAPYVSVAEMVKKFQSNTRKIELPHNKSLSYDDTASLTQRRPKLTLTRPIEPALETSQRSRPTKVKSSAELEEEMLANIPKFRARPVNKKILEAPSLPAPPRSTPQPQEFQEFHLKTMGRANQHAGSLSVSISSSVDSSNLNQWKPHKLTEPKPPMLETSLRARPPRIKSSQELEQEELERIPRFKARPLNKKIFESKGDLGVFCNPKRQLTVPQEFHFATNERIPPPAAVVDIFDKLSLNSEQRHEQQKLPRITQPNPFPLHTEERGLEKERRLAEELLQKQLEEERARIRKANPYPYTTDYPVIPPKPEPKECTRPEGFQLESLVRHEEVMKRKMEERERMEREDARMKIFRAQPILKEDPIPVPEKQRMPLTEVQEFPLHADHRAVNRAEFDKKIKEKEMMYKRYREEYECAKQMEEEKAVKQMRLLMVPHARPIPKFANPFLPQKSSKETTKAKSPTLRVNQRQERRKTTCMR